MKKDGLNAKTFILLRTYFYFFHGKVNHLSVQYVLFLNLTIVSTLQTYVTTNVLVMSKIWESNRNLALDFQVLCFVSKIFSAEKYKQSLWNTISNRQRSYKTNKIWALRLEI